MMAASVLANTAWSQAPKTIAETPAGHLAIIHYDGLQIAYAMVAALIVIAALVVCCVCCCVAVYDERRAAKVAPLGPHSRSYLCKIGERPPATASIGFAAEARSASPLRRV
jgi:hypothetical protein